MERGRVELPILIPDFGGQFLGWRPCRYERDRLTRRATSIIGGPKQSQASIQGWLCGMCLPSRDSLARQLLPDGLRRSLVGGFARFRCDDCGFDRLMPFSCKARAMCPSGGGRRMTERAAHLLDHVFPDVPVRQAGVPGAAAALGWSGC